MKSSKEFSTFLVKIQIELPSALLEQALAFVDEGSAVDLNTLLTESLHRYLTSHSHRLTESFMKDDILWGLRGVD